MRCSNSKPGWVVAGRRGGGGVYIPTRVGLQLDAHPLKRRFSAAIQGGNVASASGIPTPCRPLFGVSQLPAIVQPRRDPQH